MSHLLFPGQKQEIKLPPGRSSLPYPRSNKVIICFFSEAFTVASGVFQNNESQVAAPTRLASKQRVHRKPQHNWDRAGSPASFSHIRIFFLSRSTRDQKGRYLGGKLIWSLDVLVKSRFQKFKKGGDARCITSIILLEELDPNSPVPPP